MEHPRILLLHGNSDARFALEEFLSEGPFEILFAHGGTNGLKISEQAKPGVGTADLQLQNVNGIPGLKISSTGRSEARLVVVDSAASLNLREEPLEFVLVGKLERTGNPAERLQEAPGRSSDPPNYWKSLLESFLDSNYGNPDLSFAVVMQDFRFSRSYGCKLFKRHFGKPFLEKLREIRIARAVQLITETRMYMNEIATECGFRSPNRFCEAFRRIHGVSPVEFRKRNFKKDGTRGSN
ncbi:MAG: helix-turn-helix transcriptional regulator [Candidatus Latescibacteria bacterium]|nr:helix-turn-helix transcriptional regulator [Candidatus Latescibacterota bacterium]